MKPRFTPAFFFIVLVTFTISKAQPAIQWGNPLDRDGKYLQAHLGAYDDAFFRIVTDKEGVYAQKLSYNFGNPEEFKLSLPALANQKKMELRTVLPMKDKLMILATKGKIGLRGLLPGMFVSQAGEFDAISWVLDLNGQPNYRPLELYSRDETSTRDKMWFVSSPDSTRALAAFAAFNKEATQVTLSFELTSKDAYENKVHFEHSLAYEFSKPKSAYNSIWIDDVALGNKYAYLLVRSQDAPNGFPKNWRTTIKILRVDVITKKAEEIDLEQPTGWSCDPMDFKIDENEMLYCAGHISSDESGKREGAFFFKMNGEKMTPPTFHYNPYPPETVKYLKVKSFGGITVEPDRYITKLFVTDNSMLMVKEGQNLMSNQVDNLYRYFDLIVDQYFFETGKIMHYMIPKKQDTKNDGGRFSSYGLAISDNDYYLFFNDNPANLDITSGSKAREVNGLSKDIMVMMKIEGSTGSLSKKVQMTSNGKDENGMTPSPRHLFQRPDGTIIIYKDGKKTFTYGSLKL